MCIRDRKHRESQEEREKTKKKIYEYVGQIDYHYPFEDSRILKVPETVYVLPIKSIVVPALLALASILISLYGTLCSSMTFKISCPTAPVAPTTAMVISFMPHTPLSAYAPKRQLPAWYKIGCNCFASPMRFQMNMIASCQRGSLRAELNGREIVVEKGDIFISPPNSVLDIKEDGRTILLIECKHCKQNLDLHNTQLSKYYAASNARFG